MPRNSFPNSLPNYARSAWVPTKHYGANTPAGSALGSTSIQRVSPVQTRVDTETFQRCIDELIQVMNNHGYSHVAIGSALIEAQATAAGTERKTGSARKSAQEPVRAIASAGMDYDPTWGSSTRPGGISASGMQDVGLPETGLATEPGGKEVPVWPFPAFSPHRVNEPAHPRVGSIPDVDVEELLRECYTLVRRRFSKLPTVGAKAGFLKRLTGMLMTTAAIAEPITATGVPVAPAWNKRPGRPRLGG